MAAKKHRIEVRQGRTLRRSVDVYVDPRDEKFLRSEFLRLVEDTFPGPARRLDLSEWSMEVRSLSGSGVVGSVRARVTCEPSGEIRIRR